MKSKIILPIVLCIGLSFNLQVGGMVPTISSLMLANNTVRGIVGLFKVPISFIAKCLSSRVMDWFLMQACSMGSVKAVEILLPICSAKEINKVHSDGRTPLHWACYNNKLKMVTLLIEHGAKESVNKCDYMGYSPLHRACENCSSEIVKLLLINGANVKNEDIDYSNYDWKISDLLYLIYMFDSFDDTAEKIELLERVDEKQKKIVFKRMACQLISEALNNSKSVEETSVYDVFKQLKIDNKGPFKESLFKKDIKDDRYLRLAWNLIYKPAAKSFVVKDSKIYADLKIICE